MKSIGNTIKTVVLLTLISSLFLITGYFIGGQTGLFLSVLISLAFNFGSYFYSDKIVLSMHNAKEVGPSDKIFQMVSQLAQNAQIPTPRVYTYQSNDLNAFATGRNPEKGVVALSSAIIRELNEEELKGVIAHELAHIKNRDVLIATISATLATAISYLGNFIFFAPNNDEEGGVNPFYSIFLMIFAPIIATLIQFSISRSREYVADATGAKIANTPIGLVSALKKISASYKNAKPDTSHQAMSHMYIFNPFSGSNIKSLFSTHPPVQKRIDKLISVSNI